jgi:hypothetical protein
MLPWTQHLDASGSPSRTKTLRPIASHSSLQLTRTSPWAHRTAAFSRQACRSYGTAPMSGYRVGGAATSRRPAVRVMALWSSAAHQAITLTGSPVAVTRSPALWTRTTHCGTRCAAWRRIGHRGGAAHHTGHEDGPGPDACATHRVALPQQPRPSGGRARTRRGSHASGECGERTSRSCGRGPNIKAPTRTASSAARVHAATGIPETRGCRTAHGLSTRDQGLGHCDGDPLRVLHPTTGRRSPAGSLWPGSASATLPGLA